MIKIIVKFSPEYEMKRVKETLEKLSWFKDSGYNIKLPKGISADLGTNILDEEVKEFITAEYIEDDFRVKETYLLENWDNVCNGMYAELTKTSLVPRDTYTIYLTKYGVGGSYHYPDVIIVNAGLWGQGLLRTVFHEMIHLMIHQWIVEYKVNHWQKERIVDLLMAKFVSQISREQQISAEITEPVDRVFNEYYPNIESVIKNVGLLPRNV